VKLLKAKDIIRERGLNVFARKAQAFIRGAFGFYMAKLFSRSYINGFLRLYQHSPNTWPKTYWLGIPILKCPLDLWIYQEIIFETQPEIIIETGTAYGGSALYFAHILDLIGRGEVVTIDIDDKRWKNSKISHPRIIKITGNSVSDEIISRVRDIVGNKTVMVSLDSDHKKNHVLKEMELYSEFVSLGNYLIVEDTNLDIILAPEDGDGPMGAVKEFLRYRDDFEVDSSKEKHLLTLFPKGFLKRVKPQKWEG